MKKINFDNHNLNLSVSFFRFPSKKLLIAIISFVNFISFTTGNKQIYAQVPIVVTADQPNVWTLEQAHYLLAQMHRRNLDLKAKGLTDLDANAINGIKLDILKTLLEVGIEYSGEDRFNNGQAKNNQVFNSTRRQELIKRNDDLQNQSLQLTQDISLLKIELNRATTQEDKDRINLEIEQKTVVLAKVDKQIEQTNNELKTLNPSTNQISETSSGSSFNGNKMGGVLDKSFSEAAKKIIENAETPPQLNASLQLDNYLQLQYEIISKQLTLLRDDVGPGERLVFLELPQSINATYDKANNKWAQSWWKILGYTKTNCLDSTSKAVVKCPSFQNNPTQTTTKTLNSIFDGGVYDTVITLPEYSLSLKELKKADELVNKLSQNPKDAASQYLYDGFTEKTKKLLTEYESLVKKLAVGSPLPRPTEELLTSLVKELNSIIKGNSLIEQRPGLFTLSARTKHLDKANLTDYEVKQLNRKLLEDIYSNELFQATDTTSSTDKKNDFVNLNKQVLNDQLKDIKLVNNQVRTVDLIPRQTSLNVNDIKLRNRAGALNIVASFLFGFGANLNYQRQHEQYSQFVQQELYSSAFGKGSREFGWTFTPMPGTERLLSGVRTTYAIVVVPQEATSLIIDSAGCYFRRTDSQPQNFTEANLTRTNNSGCSDNKAFVIPIPGGGDVNNDFYVQGLTYQPVKKKNRIVVSIYGDNFSTQIGVLINGVPLKPSLGIAQPFILDDSVTGEKTKTELSTQPIKGNFERIDSDQIVATFEMPEDFEGTPTITLVAPGISIDLNRLDNLFINNVKDTSLENSKWMFGNKPSGKAELKIESVDLFPTTAQVVDKIEKVPVTKEKTIMVKGRLIIKKVNTFEDKPIYKDQSQLTAFIYGNGFSGCKVYANGVLKTQDQTTSTAKFLNIPLFPIPLDETIKFSLICSDGEDLTKSSAIKNPLFKHEGTTPAVPPTYNPLLLKIDKVNFISYEDTSLIVELEGIGFTDDLKPSVGELVVKSPTSAILQIDPAKASQVVTFTDSKLNLFVKAIIARKTPEKSENKVN